MSCVSVSALTINLENNCKPVAVGLKEQIYVGTRDEVASYTLDSTNDKIVTAIVMKTGKKLKKWEGYKLQHKATVGFTAGDNGNKLPHGLTFMVNNNSPEADKEIDRIAQRSDLFAIVKQQGEYGRWTIQGFTTGLTMTNLNKDSNDANNAGLAILEFVAAQETEMPKTLKHITSTLDDTEEYLGTLVLTS